MGKLAGFAIAKGLELSLMVPLWETYGSAHDLHELINRFAAQPELGRVGTVTSLVMVVGIFAATTRMIFEYATNSLDAYKAKSVLRRPVNFSDDVTEALSSPAVSSQGQGLLPVERDEFSQSSRGMLPSER